MIINEKEYANVIAKNLRRLALEYDKTQNDIVALTSWNQKKKLFTRR